MKVKFFDSINLFDNRESFINLKDKQDLVGVEIGVESGNNARNILRHLNIKKLYLVDPWCHYGGMGNQGVFSDNEIAKRCFEATKQRIEEFKDKVVFIETFSVDAVEIVPDDLDFVYLDGNHRYEYVKQDIELWYPKVKIGGMLSGHDFKGGAPGVQEAVEEYFGDDYVRPKSTWDWFHIKKRDKEK